MPSTSVLLGERSYPIVVGRGLLAQAGRWARQRGIAQKTAVVVTQKPVALYYKEIISDSLAKEGYEASFFIPPAAKSSEASKSQAVYSKLIRHIAAVDGKGRSVFLAALGGGVVGDLAGFAAAVYRRGVPYIQIPTTVTAQVDSAIGGKTGIDLPEGKNLLGVIYQPSLVLSDVETLNSLPDRQWNDGFAEVIKYGMIRDTGLFVLLEKKEREAVRQGRLLEEVVFRCAKIKARIVEKDEYDKKNMRIVLNFGHTAGHAIEAVSRFSRSYTHGEAIGVGMLIACHISERLGVLRDAKLTHRLEKLLLKYRLPVFYRGLSTAALLNAMGYDKKSESGVNRFVLPVSLGKTAVVKNVPQAVIAECLEKRKD